MIPFLEKIFKKKTLKSSVGIDIGTSAIKIVELSKKGERKKLENYGEVKTQVLSQGAFRTKSENTPLLSTQSISKAILAILKETKIQSKIVTFSIPDFSTFFTTFDLPIMKEQELSQAIYFEARNHIPLPLEDVVLDWTVTEKKHQDKKDSKNQILLVAVPKRVITQYQEVAKNCNLQLIALEAEVFGLIRSLLKPESDLAILFDMGAQTTTCSIVEKRVLKVSYTIDIAANHLLLALSQALEIDFSTAEDFLKKYGIIQTGERNLAPILLPKISLIVQEIKRIFAEHNLTEKSQLSSVILSGGMANLAGLKDYLTNELKKEVKIVNPFSDISYPPILEPVLKELGPTYSVAVGMAMRGLE